MRHRPRYLFVTAQIGAVMVALMTLAFWPPRNGPMLLLSWSRDAGTTVRVALDGGATILGQGPILGSLVIVGDRARIMSFAAARHVMVIAAPPSGCGNPEGALQAR